MNGVRMKREEAIVLGVDAVKVCWQDGTNSTLPFLWLRDNCPCSECRVTQTSEKRFIVSSVPVDLRPDHATLADDVLAVTWPDGHTSAFDQAQCQARPREEKTSGWPDGFVPPSVEFDAFLENDAVALDALDALVELGAILLRGAPSTPGTLEELAPRLGPIREVLFARIHDVEVDPAGYNVAHTSMALPPHNDFASYSWPPSVQALHMLMNECTGGASIIVDGFDVLERLRAQQPDAFEALCTMRVPFREFDDDNETYAVEPMVRCDAAGNITALRFSNQLMQAVNPEDAGVVEFYRAYHELSKRVTDPASASRFRMAGGDILIVAAHRVLHGRDAFDVDGARRLQDAYFEFDNVRNQRVVLRRRVTNRDG